MHIQRWYQYVVVLYARSLIASDGYITGLEPIATGNSGVQARKAKARLVTCDRESSLNLTPTHGPSTSLGQDMRIWAKGFCLCPYCRCGHARASTFDTNRSFGFHCHLDWRLMPPPHDEHRLVRRMDRNFGLVPGSSKPLLCAFSPGKWVNSTIMIVILIRRLRVRLLHPAWARVTCDS